MIFRQVVTHIRHIAQLTLLLCDIAMYGLLAYEFGFYQSAISNLSPEVALATIGVAILINILFLQQLDFYANFYCLQPTVLFKRSITALCIVEGGTKESKGGVLGGSEGASNNKSTPADNNVVSVGFRDVFGPRPS